MTCSFGWSTVVHYLAVRSVANDSTGSIAAMDGRRTGVEGGKAPPARAEGAAAETVDEPEEPAARERRARRGGRGWSSSATWRRSWPSGGAPRSREDRSERRTAAGRHSHPDSASLVRRLTPPYTHRGMPGTVIVGAQWGDEGKGKITDLLAERADAVVRFQGGNNAGHTIVRDGDDLEAAPRAVGHPAHRQDVRDRQRRGDRPQGAHRRARRAAPARVDTQCLKVSANAHLIMPYHMMLDHAGEAKLGKLQIGTTRRGIGPCYADKAARLGIRMQDLLDEKILKKKIVAALEPKRLSLRAVRQGSAARPADDDRGVPHLRPPARAAHRRHEPAGAGALDAGKHVVFEGAQGALLDIDHGTYPFVTSSNPVAGAACIGAGVGPKDIDEVWGITKAYSTRVGSGPVPDRARRRARRRAARARRRVRDDHRPRPARRLARPRRPALRGAHQLDDRAGGHQARRAVGHGPIQVCTRYRGAEGAEFDHFPYHQTVLHHATGEYVELPGWSEDLSGCREERAAAAAATTCSSSPTSSGSRSRWSAWGPGAMRSSGPYVRCRRL